MLEELLDQTSNTLLTRLKDIRREDTDAAKLIRASYKSGNAITKAFDDCIGIQQTNTGFVVVTREDDDYTLSTPLTQILSVSAVESYIPKAIRAAYSSDSSEEAKLWHQKIRDECRFIDGVAHVLLTAHDKATVYPNQSRIILSESLEKDFYFAQQLRRHSEIEQKVKDTAHVKRNVYVQQAREDPFVLQDVVDIYFTGKKRERNVDMAQIIRYLKPDENYDSLERAIFWQKNIPAALTLGGISLACGYAGYVINNSISNAPTILEAVGHSLLTGVCGVACVLAGVSGLRAAGILPSRGKELYQYMRKRAGELNQFILKNKEHYDIT